MNDALDVFRKAADIPGHVEDILAMKPRPKVVWFQLGIKHDDAAKILEAAGITVIQNRCTLADHQRLGLGAPTAHPTMPTLRPASMKVSSCV